jgi:hypothetical protein
MNPKQENRTSLEQFDTIQRVIGLLQKNQDVSCWDVEEVKAWLQTNHQLARYSDTFKHNEVDGYTLLTLNDEDMLLSLRISQLHDRKALAKAIKKLVILWVNFGKNCNEFF